PIPRRMPHRVRQQPVKPLDALGLKAICAPPLRLLEFPPVAERRPTLDAGLVAANRRAPERRGQLVAHAASTLRVFRASKDSYASAYAAAVRVMLKSLTTRWRPARPIARARSGLVSNSIIAAANSSGLPTGTNRPVSPGRTTSRLPPTSVATTGSPAAIASSRVIAIPSLRDESTNRSASARKLPTSER